MANSYRQFSLVLNLDNKKEETWCRKTLKKLSQTESAEGGSETDFDWTVYPAGEDPKSHPWIWFHDGGEYGNVEQIADFVEKYLKKFQPKGYFVLSWADTCSKSRVGEFGGGLAVVTANGPTWFNDSDWVNTLTKRLESRNGS